MNRKRLLKIAVVVMAAILLATMSGISATKVYELGFKNKLDTGSVAIDLTTLSVDTEGNEVESSTQRIAPGTTVSYIPNVKNLRKDAYVRLRFEFEMSGSSTTPVTAENIQGLGSDWVKKGDYFYCKKALTRGESSRAFTGLSIPSSWDNNATGFTVKAYADAVQAENFTPNFDSSMPWGSIVIEEAKADEIANYGVAAPITEPNTLEFKEDSGLEASTSDLFSGFTGFMAGTERSDTLLIKNASKRPITVYFKTKTTNSDLLKKVALTISFDGKNLYSGDLSSLSLEEYKELSKIPSGESKTFNYALKLPEDAENYYTALAEELEWMFKVAEDDPNNPDPNNPDNPTPDNPTPSNPTPETPSSSIDTIEGSSPPPVSEKTEAMSNTKDSDTDESLITRISKGAKTGDNQMLLLWFIIFAASASGFTLAIMTLRREARHEGN